MSIDNLDQMNKITETAKFLMTADEANDMLLVQLQWLVVDQLWRKTMLIKYPSLKYIVNKQALIETDRHRELLNDIAFMFKQSIEAVETAFLNRERGNLSELR